IVGGVSGFGGAMIASGSFVMANTLSIAVGSFSYSSGMAGLSSKAIQPSISLGFGSYNFETGDFRSIFKWKNLNKQEKIGYSFGALANISDILAGFNPATFDYRAENAPVGWGDDRSKIDWVSHAQINDLAKNKPVIDWSGRLPVGQQNLARGTPLAIKDILFHKTIEISRVNAKTLYWWKDILEKTKYNVFFNNCAQAAARGLTISGVPVLKIHPWLLWGQLYARLIGIRPSLYSYYIMF
ncbi:MAG: hypothetical protein HPY79_02950, partial [Bacteroidales bacterium]|nr:hypothetical protein [Bacteroidales bacterium]